MRFSFQASLLLLPSALPLPGINAQVLREAASSPIEMVVSANNLATDAGKKILAAGGTAVDAMIAVQTVLGLVEPQSSGIAGGAFVVYYDGTKLTTFDAREKAGAEATETRYQDANGQSLGFFDAWQSALSVGVPGVPRMMEDLHMKYGTLPWADLFEDAKDLAINGFNFTGRTESNANELLAENDSCEDRLFFRDPVAFDYFIDNATCKAKPAGTFVTNLEYAETLEALATGGADAFYTGAIAEDIIAKIAGDRKPTDDPIISLQDLLDYEVIEREPVCKTYRNETYNVCGMGPPSSGALAIGQIFGILENFDFTDMGPQDVETVHLFTQAMRLAFADRNLYVGDSDFITVPVEGMLNETYLTERASLISETTDMGTAMPGTPPGIYDPAAPQITTFEGGTSHISIVDQFGNAISMTTTVESYFGSGLMVRGFLLNNQLTDFSFENVNESGTPIANRVQPGKRPRSSMSPTIVLDSTGEVAFLAGSPGGSRIIGYTSEALMLMMDFGYNPQQAANTPHFQNRNGATEIEPPKVGITTTYNFEALMAALAVLNHTVEERGGETSGLSLIEVMTDGFLGGADPRRDGTAGGRMDNGTMATVAPAATATPGTMAPVEVGPATATPVTTAPVMMTSTAPTTGAPTSAVTMHDASHFAVFLGIVALCAANLF